MTGAASPCGSRCRQSSDWNNHPNSKEIRMKTVIAVLVGALALTGAAEAQAFDWYESKSKSVHAGAGADSCVSPDHVDVIAPAYAHNLEAVAPLPGQQFDAHEGGEGEEVGKVQVTGVAPAGDAMRFSLQPVGGWCEPYHRAWESDPDYLLAGEEGYWVNYPDEGWQTEWREKFTVRWQVQKRIVLRGRASSLADEAIARRISWWYETAVTLLVAAFAAIALAARPLTASATWPSGPSSSSA